MAPSVGLLFLSLLSLASSLPPPRNSFLLNSADRALIFSLPDVHNTTTLLLSDDGSTLYVGARDTLLSLDVSQSDAISLKKKVEWRPPEREVNQCQSKVKNPTVDCTNFVRVLQLINSTHLYVCGSYAFSPHDAFVDIETFSLVQHGDAKGRCPFSPSQRNTALTVDGELFTATTSDFRGMTPQISRHFSKDGRPDVSQDTSIKTLEEPTFVSSSLDPSDGKLYFFFSEVGTEFSFVDELQIARVAQVCKGDVGGERTLQKKWTSFMKASLLCQLPKQLPFTVLQDVFTLQPPEGSNASETLYYGVFASQWSSALESAVCVFKLQDVRTAFSRNYKTWDKQCYRWKKTQVKHSNFGKCGLDSASDSELEEVKKNFLTSNNIRPVGGGPVLVSSGQRYSHVAAMMTQAANGKRYTILFLLTETGFVHKVVLFDQGPVVIEEIQVFTQPQVAETILLSSSKGVLYVGTSEGVAAVPVAMCSIYRTCTQCVLARDPLCGWSRTRRVCTSQEDSPGTMAQDLEDLNVDKECRGETDTILDTEEFSIRSTDGTRVTSDDVRQIATPRPLSGKHQKPESNDEYITISKDEANYVHDGFGSRRGVQDDASYVTPTSSEGIHFRKAPPDDSLKTTTGKSYYSELVVVSLMMAACICALMVGGLYLWRLRRASLIMKPLDSPEDGGKTTASMECSFFDQPRVS